MAPVVSTRRLFGRLLKTLDVTTVCDVGSMDGSDAQFFRRRLPDATILALEPNPRNFALMSGNRLLHADGIRVLPFAASEHESEAPFFVIEAGAAQEDRLRRGMSSLHRRVESWPTDVVMVRTVRLDRLLAEQRLTDGPLAFWIDAEGMGYEVLRGAEAVLTNTRLVHVEVESAPCIGAGQHLFADVLRCLEQAGFELLATDHPLEQLQFNALFVRRDLARAHAAPIRAWLALAWLRRHTALLMRRIVPARALRRVGL